jgi:hypothetical protein
LLLGIALVTVMLKEKAVEISKRYQSPKKQRKCPQVENMLEEMTYFVVGHSLGTELVNLRVKSRRILPLKIAKLIDREAPARGALYWLGSNGAWLLRDSRARPGTKWTI